MTSLDHTQEHSSDLRKFSTSFSLPYWLRIDAHDYAHRTASIPSPIAS
ncbi:hypothetical protein [Bradyrhizobium sp. SYSU BS000235]